MDVARCQTLIAELERDSERVQLHHAELVSAISWFMDEIHRLAKTDEDDQRKMQIVALETGRDSFWHGGGSVSSELVDPVTKPLLETIGGAG